MGRSDRIEILLADDDPVVRAGYAKKVRAHGWSLTLAADGFEAMQSVRNGDFDVLLLDLKMPYRNGADVLRILRQEGSLQETRVFLLAEPGDSDLVDQAMREGADGVFDKSQMGPRDVISELQVMFHSVGKARRVGGGPNENVPDDVAKLASRFRKGGAKPRGTGGSTRRAATHGATHTDRAGHERPGESPLVAQLRAQLAAQSALEEGSGQGTSMAPHAPLGGDPGASQMGNQMAHQPAVPLAPAPVPPPRGSLRNVPGGHGGAQRPPPPPAAQGYAGSPGNGSYDRPPAYDSFAGPHGHSGMPNPGGIPLDQPGPPTAEPLPNEPCFDTVLNKMVGEASRLAQYLGLPADFSCPVCRNTLILRLWPEPGQEATVVGHFFCPGCTRA